MCKILNGTTGVEYNWKYFHDIGQLKIKDGYVFSH